MEKASFSNRWLGNIGYSVTSTGYSKKMRVRVGKRKLVERKLVAENWWIRKLVDANISQDLIIKEKNVLINNVEWQFEIEKLITSNYFNRTTLHKFNG